MGKGQKARTLNILGCSSCELAESGATISLEVVATADFGATNKVASSAVAGAIDVSNTSFCQVPCCCI